MDIQKEREAFEKQGNIRIFVKQCWFDDQLNEYSSKTLHEYTLGFINGAWWAWQTAKANAVPEDSVVVSKWTLALAMNSIENNEDNEGVIETLQELINEAQEPAND